MLTNNWPHIQGDILLLLLLCVDFLRCLPYASSSHEFSCEKSCSSKCCQQHAATEEDFGFMYIEEGPVAALLGSDAVSYTHLTLPTKA